MPIAEAQLAAARAGRLSTEDYEQLVRTQVEKATSKLFADITSDELASVKSNGPLGMKSARSKLVKEKRNKELNEAAKLTLIAVYEKWMNDGGPVDGIRRWDGAIGIFEKA